MYTPPLEGKPPSLFNKIAAIQGAVGDIKEDAHVNIPGGAKYSYISETALLKEIRPLLAKANVAAFVSVDSQDGDVMAIVKKDGKPGSLTRASVSISCTFADGDSGEMFVVRGQGQAQDSGDKAVYKAMTSAHRYLWWKTMLVGSGEDAAGTPSEEFAFEGSGAGTESVVGGTPDKAGVADREPATPATNGDGPYISKGDKSQQQVLWITATENKVPKERVREIVLEICGAKAAEHTEFILKKDFQAVLDAIKMDGVPFG